MCGSIVLLTEIIDRFVRKFVRTESVVVRVCDKRVRLVQNRRIVVEAPQD